MAQKILLVDDDINLLSALRRNLRNKFDLLIANGPEKALEYFQGDTVIAVAVVDMRMPGMDGVELLQKVKESSPDTVRIMLTGNADQQTATDAINQGNIFRFFSKPCPAETLAEGIEAGLAQYKLITAERELLEHTLAGSVKVLVDILSMVDPIGFGHSDKIREWAYIVARHLKLKQPWRLGMAAMLSQLGNITIPPEIIVKKTENVDLTEEELEIIDEAPRSARDLIANIPRLKDVAEVVYLQNRGFDGSGFPEGGLKGKDIPKNARILKILIDLEAQTIGHFPTRSAFEVLSKQASLYDANLLSEIRKCLEHETTEVGKQAFEEVAIPVSLLNKGYLLKSDLKLSNNHLILGSGVRLTNAHIQKIRAFSKMHKFQEPVTVVRKA